MNNLNFKHEMDDDGNHRIVETTSNTIGNWSLYDSPAFLLIEDKMFAVLTAHYQSLNTSFPPIETVFEMITLHTEHCKAPHIRAKYLT